MTSAGAASDREAPGSAPLTGFTVGVTAERQHGELVRLLERRGARVVSAPTMRTVPLAEDDAVLEATRACLAAPLDAVVATTGVGFRGWLEAAEGADLRERLIDQLASARLLPRGPKARGAVRAAGLKEAWVPESETSTEILDHLLADDLRGCRVAIQLHGEPQPDFVDALRRAGAAVVEVPVYRWERPVDLAPVRRLIARVIARQVDAVTFTSAPAASGLLNVAAETGQEAALLDAFRRDVVAACVGQVTAGPLDHHGVPTSQPARARTKALVQSLADELPARRGRVVAIGDRVLEVRGHAAVLDGEPVELSAAPMAVLRALAERPGQVVSRAVLRSSLPSGDAGSHAVDAAVARLRAALGDATLVKTVVKRGYRLACAPAYQGSMP